jgi:hypothetical protein
MKVSITKRELKIICESAQRLANREGKRFVLDRSKIRIVRDKHPSNNSWRTG